MRPKYRPYSRKRESNPILFVLAGMCFLAAIVLTVVNYTRFKSVGTVYPIGSTIADIPVGGLSRKAAEARLREAYSIPIELRYRGARVQINPEQLGFGWKMDETLHRADEQIPEAKWSAFLWGKRVEARPFNLPGQFSQDTSAIRMTLEQTFRNRYDQSPSASVPIVQSAHVLLGEPGFELSGIDAAVESISQSLTSPTQRVVELKVTETPALPVSWENLEIQLRQTIKLEGFDGLVELYLYDLQDDRMMHFATRGGVDVPVDVAYSGASTVKIPIMVSTMRQLNEPIPATALNWMRSMIKDSLNPPADGLMKNYLDNHLGPLKVTEDMMTLGYENTFMAGFFEPGSPLLRLFETPANLRRDVFLRPDTYNQTVPSEIGDLLKRIYRCAHNEGLESTLFDGQVTQGECQIMIDNLLANKMGALIEVGVGVEGRVAHKHGWTSETDGLLHTISDVGIVYSPGGNYVLVIFMHSENQLLFDTGNILFARLSQSIYNAYNPTQQAIVYTD